MKANLNDVMMENDENSDIIHLWEPLEFKIDEDYKYISKGMIFSIFSDVLYYGIAIPILKLLTKIIYDLKIEGKENLRTVENGAVTVSNHVLFLDCAMVGLACDFKKIYYTTREGSFKIPFVRKLIKLLRAIPIPDGIESKKYFIKAVDSMLQEGKLVHFYPEAALHPYCNSIRKFKEGAFRFAVNNNVPVIPMVFKFRQPKGIRKIVKRKPDVTLVILEPISIKQGQEEKRVCIENLKQMVHQKMKEA